MTLPTPYYVSRDGTITLYCADCLAILPELPSGSVDAVVTDPPYSSGGKFRSEIIRPTNEKYNGFTCDDNGSRKPSAFYSAFSGDNKDGRLFMAWSKDWMDAAFQLAKDGAYFACTTDWRQLPAVTDAMQYANWSWRGMLVWDKKIGRPVEGRFRNHVEYVVWGSRGGFSGKPGVYADSVHYETPPNHLEREHVTEKTVGLIEFVLSVVHDDSTILDPFLGSGTTAVACIKTGRKCIGIELSEAYCAIAARRCEEAFDSQALFRREAT